MVETRRGSNSGRSPGGAATKPTAEAFLKTLSRSGLIERNRLEKLLSAVSSSIRRSANRLAEHLIEIGELTHYQTEKLLSGRWRSLVVGDYHILAPLGRGGMGTVYLAKSLAQPVASPYPLFPLVALKVLPPKRAREDAKTLLRFRREMELGKHLDHPNITRTLDAGEQNGVYYIAMDYVPGISLRQLVTREKSLPAAEAARLFADVASGLGHAHERGLIHRDLKPSNIMVTPEGQAKILDLGLALLVDEALPEDRTIVGGEGYILGTMDYIAPEQTADATDVGPHSDIYSLGCSIYYAVCGVTPFPGGTAKQKMQWHRTETAPAANSINPAVPAAFAGIIEQLMAKDPEKRPASAESVRQLLLPWAGAARPLGENSPHTDREVVAEIDSRSVDPTLWDAIPVAELVEPAKDSNDKQRTERKPDSLRILLFVLGGCGLVGGLAALAVLVTSLRRL